MTEKKVVEDSRGTSVFVSYDNQKKKHNRRRYHSKANQSTLPLGTPTWTVSDRHQFRDIKAAVDIADLLHLRSGVITK